ncbi:MAG: ATP-binding cassette domain-containing protein [Spirochaetes bacterium]|nr:ATP-binding cassette domain-containing protein [Spirochaetota bacterium]
MTKQRTQAGVSPASPILATKDLEYRIHRKLTLRVPRFEIRPGEVVGVLGPNGAGKTTLLNLLTGIAEPHRGTIRLNGKNLRQQTALELAAQRSVMRAAHVHDAAQGLTVREIVALGTLSNPMHPRLANVIAASLAHRFDLVHLMHSDFSVLSSGEKQRVHTARIFMQLYGREPGHLVFLDEPYAHLDARHTQVLAHELSYLRGEGAGIVCILHDINFASRHCDRIYFMKDATLVREVRATQIYNRHLLENIYDASFAIVRAGREKYVVSRN